MNQLLADLRFGLRLLRQSPGFTAIALCALALGIGANTAIFSTVDSVLLRPLPYQDPDRLVYVHEDASFIGFPKNTPAPANYVDWKNQNHVFTDLAAISGVVANLTVDGPPERVTGRAVTANFFDLLGVRPLLGRVFTEEEDRSGANVVVISYGLWQRRYAGDASVIGKTMTGNGAPRTIVGVMGRNFVFRTRDDDFYVPIHFTPQQLAMRGSHFLRVIGRIKAGITLKQAQEEMNAIARRLERQYPDTNSRIGAVVEPMKEEVIGNTGLALWVLMAAAGCVLLIACANLASLLLARAVSRTRELAVRAALGAGRGRLIRQMVTEGLVLSLAGAVLGLMIAPAAMKVLTRMVPDGLPGSARPEMDARVLAFTLALAIATGLLFSIVPAIQAARASVNESLKQGGRTGVGGHGRRVREVLVVMEVSAALVLLVGAGLMIKTLEKLRALDLGFRPDHLLTMRTQLPMRKYKDGPSRMAFYNRVIDGVRALPGVERAAYTRLLPFESIGYTYGFKIEGMPLPRTGENDALTRFATNDYLQTLGVKLLEGRLFTSGDGPDAPPVIIINETFKRRYWPGESAIGHRVSIGWPNPVWRTVVGVIADIQERGYAMDMKPGVYLPTAQMQNEGFPEVLVMRTSMDPASLVNAARAVIASVDPEEPVADVRTMDDVVALNVADRQQQMTLLGSFAALALLLASIGLYGVLSYAVTQRSREIGLRMALGASASSMIASVVGRGLSLTGAGLTLGAAIAWAATRAMKNLLYGVQATDPWTFAGVAALLTAVAVIACWIPARRASRVDPAIVLREE